MQMVFQCPFLSEQHLKALLERKTWRYRIIMSLNNILKHCDSSIVNSHSVFWFGCNKITIVIFHFHVILYCSLFLFTFYTVYFSFFFSYDLAVILDFFFFLLKYFISMCGYINKYIYFFCNAISPTFIFLS